MATYDVLYLQRHEHIGGVPIVQPWKVNDDDIEYMPATPKRKAADEMYEVIMDLVFSALNPSFNYDKGIVEKAHVALALADGDGGE